MARDANGVAQAAPNDVLLLRGCVACHTGTNDATNVIPYVNSTTEPTYNTDGTTGNTLAGGNFYWVAGGGLPATGHNVGTDTLAGADATLGNTPPGGTALTAQLRCAGANGCHGDVLATSDFAAIKGTHHANDTVIDGLTVGTSFRFLKGILGKEGTRWEYQPTSASHNQYKGFDRTDETDPLNTISSLCARCHKDFHNGSGKVSGATDPTFASPWVRHPTDFDMGNTGATSEYRNYGGVGVHAYKVSAPVASTDVSAIKASVTFADDTIVTCLSCHRAHGTKYADLLRWDYSTVTASSSGTGACFECHTTK